MNDDDKRRLLEQARLVRSKAYAPYSKFQVGAAVMARDGQIFTGVNVENASFPAGVCAETNAVAAAVAAGEQDLVAVCVITQMSPPASPCGVCRQVLAEFGPNMQVVLATPNPEEPPVSMSLADLLPGHFNGDAL